MMTSAPDDHKGLLRQRLDTLRPCPADSFAGRGIVICAGGPVLFTNAYVLVHLLRLTHGCRLPIEVWHFGHREMSERMKLVLRELDADTVDAEAVLAAHPAAIANGWQLKAYALMWSRFAEVLLLDADQVALRDPALVFGWDDYRRTGAVLWPDRGDLLSSNPVWEACGLTPRDCPAIESGQLLIDKTRHWPALQVALHLNEHAAYYYRMLYGDKDTFLLGLLLTGADYTLVPHRPFSDMPFCLLQRTMTGEVLFQHRTGAKFHYAAPPLRLERTDCAEGCVAALAALRANWNGLVITPPPRGLRARQAERALVETRDFVLRRPGDSDLAVALLPGFEIGGGRAAAMMSWHCEDGADGLDLVIGDAFGPAWRLQRDARGWIGRATEGDRAIFLGAARLTPHPTLPETTPPAGSLAAEILAAAGFPNPGWMARRDDIAAALRLVAAIEPATADALIALAAGCRPSERAVLDAMAEALRGTPRDADLDGFRGLWPLQGCYTAAADLDT